ncbi:hypothetical protein [Chitinimonas koreensis]|uniref:hypothetical protein n=1 Tax=Chitinimonas koreensis TaxID=356302 RepID=UPI000421AE3F|nr:hypothetical protein [Chitinimonas koreensis]QNM98302.1 hypothetical protein H9L41_08725 [Chitinimonas koreensis]
MVIGDDLAGDGRLLSDIERAIVIGLVRGQQKAELAAELAQHFAVPLPRAHREIDEFEIRLKHMGLIE